jgi:hypothetical protein
MNRQQRTTLYIALVVVGGAMVTCAGLAGITALSHRSADTPDSPATYQPITTRPLTKDPGVVETGNGAVIAKDFRENPIAAEAKWVGKRIRMFGTVTSMSRDTGGHYLGFYGGFFVHPAKDQLEKFGTARRNDELEIEGTIYHYEAGPGLAFGTQVYIREARYVRFKRHIGEAVP